MRLQRLDGKIDYHSGMSGYACDMLSIEHRSEILPSRGMCGRDVSYFYAQMLSVQFHFPPWCPFLNWSGHSGQSDLLLPETPQPSGSILKLSNESWHQSAEVDDNNNYPIRHGAGSFLRCVPEDRRFPALSRTGTNRILEFCLAVPTSQSVQLVRLKADNGR